MTVGLSSFQTTLARDSATCENTVLHFVEFSMFGKIKNASIKINLVSNPEFAMDYQATLVVFVEGDSSSTFFFNNHSEIGEQDGRLAEVVQAALNWCIDNEVNLINEDTEILISDLSDKYSTTIGAILAPFKQRKEKEQEPDTNEEEFDEFYQSYSNLGGTTPPETFKKYLRFFMIIIPTTYVGDGYEIGLDGREHAISIWTSYLKLNGIKQPKKEAELIFRAVDAVHTLS
jgi:hypothetical protein